MARRGWERAGRRVLVRDAVPADPRKLVGPALQARAEAAGVRRDVPAQLPRREAAAKQGVAAREEAEARHAHRWAVERDDPRAADGWER
jgi:hypothetical protein